ncbi:hypothetical protein [Niabella ginsengisoli]|uniref:RagB/SusD family nutrient uptake outer membrane protein n=1 Tax=Niabella ginsengisoli TaxID=522298 RepID=A0ABS9SFK2_9BACT|nr:hypothetical protein [Niabella ginsengisoli]MCH5597135.1 hypothetical protein [Niabella ginsengisoli]
MKKSLIYFFLIIITCLQIGCIKDSEFLTRKPTDVIGPDDLWTDNNLVLSVLADFYDRYPDFQRIDRWWEYTNFEEAFPSAAGDYWRIQNTDWAYDWWSTWDYAFVRDLNMFIATGTASTTLAEADKKGL